MKTPHFRFSGNMKTVYLLVHIPDFLDRWNLTPPDFLERVKTPHPQIFWRCEISTSQIFWRCENSTNPDFLVMWKQHIHYEVYLMAALSEALHLWSFIQLFTFRVCIHSDYCFVVRAIRVGKWNARKEALEMPMPHRYQQKHDAQKRTNAAPPTASF